MSLLEWKSVELFDFVTLPSIQLNENNTEITSHCCNIVKAANGRTSTTFVFCAKSGNVYVVIKNGVKSRQIIFKCHDSHKPIKLCSITTTNLLAIVSQKDKYALCICIYDLNQIKKEEHPPCISTANMQVSSTATSLHIAVIGPDKLLALGVGFEKGDILLHFGTNRELALSIRRHTVALSPINGIQFTTCDQQNEMRAFNVFVISVDAIYCLVLNDKNTIDSKMVLDNNKNISNQCCTLSQPVVSDSFLVVGRNDAIYCFRSDCRGPCYAIEGQKQFLSWIDNYLLVVVKTNFGSAITVVDIDNKLIVLHKRISTVMDIISFNKLYYFITKDENSKNVCAFNVYALNEYQINIKVRTLIEKCMHDSALMMLEREENPHQYDDVAYVRLKYGNNLLAKGFYARAVSEYAQTIGILKPYHIISKLLSSRHNDNLIQYVNNLLKSKIITNEHHKLLQRCLDRTSLRSRIEQLWISRNDTTRISDFKQISVRSSNMSHLMDTWNNFQETDFNNNDESDIFNFYLEYGKELLLADTTIVLNTMKSLVKSKKIKDILRFLIIFPNYLEFNANLLSYYVENCSFCDEKLLYYLLTLYLGLWREKKILSKDITDLVKKMPIRFEKILTLSKTYLFNIDIENLGTNEEPQFISEEHKNFLQCLNQHIKKNPNLTSLLTISHQSLLTILQKLCGGSEIKLRDTKPFLTEKFIKNTIDAKSELKSIADLNCEIAIHSSLESHYKQNPIEFRNRYCDVCRQSLHMPAIYYLCQHSFHKDCLRFNYNIKEGDDVGCVLCATNLKYFESDDENIYLSCKSYDIIKGISNVFASGIDNLLISEDCDKEEYYNAVVSNDMTNQNTSERTKNPFDDNYDSKYNCS
ncbi:vacuolar protein sorting-associated protein 11 homolog [Drosophila hydei]|uniref:Vacuolar protein sorting-associated protein 11 homolog n=1 Tax=Drosophila hydei TaxID=7224 RepID=A0A6J1M1P6_DROHY|nr:vacuolar protein sorting-associated protein 11 homolog [Drosophila hydei]